MMRLYSRSFSTKAVGKITAISILLLLVSAPTWAQNGPQPVDPSPPPALPLPVELQLVDPPANGPVEIELALVRPQRPQPPSVPVETVVPAPRSGQPASPLGVNQNPVAVPDVFTTPEGVPLVVAAPGHLASDFDLDGDPIEWLSYSVPAGGTMSDTVSDGGFVYTPNPSFSGLEEITYAIGDGNGGIAFGTMLILVIDDQNLPPVAPADVFTTPEGVPLVIAAAGHLTNDFDLDGDPIEWLSYSVPANGTMSGTMADGAFVYTPDPGFSGLEEITYAIGDGNGGIAFGRMLILVVDDQNRPPVAVPDVFTTALDTPLAVTPPGHLTNDFDLDGDTVEWLSYSLPSGGVMSGTMADGSFMYTPNPAFSGLEEITYAIGDGNGGLAFSTLFIEVLPAPGGTNPIAVPDVFTTPQGDPLVVTAPGHLGNDSDPNGDPIEWLSYTVPSSGVMSGTMADGSFMYTPNPGFSGVEEITYAIGDGNGGIDFSTMSILVLDDQNRAPIAVPDTFSTPEGTPLTVAAPGHLANDFDLDGDTVEWLSYTVPSGGVIGGTMADGSFMYTPNPGFSGLEQITYAIGDGNGGIAFGDLLITVLDDQNRAPIAVPDVFITPPETPLVVAAPGQLGNDFDLDGDPIEWLSYTVPSSGVMSGTMADGSFMYTPNPGFSGVEQITYAIGDGQGGIAFGELLIFVGVVPPPPPPPIEATLPVPVLNGMGLVLLALLLALGALLIRPRRDFRTG